MNSHCRPTWLAALVSCMLPVGASASQLVYLAEHEIAHVVELYLVDLDQPDTLIKLNKPLSRRAHGVLYFALSPDGTRVAFTADQDARGDNDLYLVDLAAPRTWSRLGSLGTDWREAFVRFSPDGSKLAFTATDDSFGNTQLHLVELANPSSSVRLNPERVAGGYVSLTGFEFTADSGHVVYGAALERSEVDLYLVDLATPGVSTRLNAPGGSVGDTYEARFRMTPDGTRVVYSAVGGSPGVRELHIVSLAAPGVATTLNSPLQSQGDVFDFTISPDGKHASYTADQEVDQRLEVYLVALDAPGIATKINGPVHYGATLARFTPDSKYITFYADEERGPLEQDLYRVAVDDPTQRIRLNAALGPGESVVDLYAISRDGARVAYTPQPSDGAFKTELMLVELAAPGTAVRLNEPHPGLALEFGSFGRPEFSPNDEEVVFLAFDQDTSAQAMYFSRPAEPGTSILIGKPLPPDASFSPVPGFYQFLPADAPRVVPVPSPQPSPAPASSPRGGGGSFGIIWLLILLAAVGQRHGPVSALAFFRASAALSPFSRIVFTATRSGVETWKRLPYRRSSLSSTCTPSPGACGTSMVPSGLTAIGGMMPSRAAGTKPGGS